MNLKEVTKQVRLDLVDCIGTLGVGHIGGSLSIVEVLVALYFKHMNVNPMDPKMEGRDRLIVSKGHAGPAVYATLANKGFFSKDWLKTLNRNGTNLPSHCDMNRTPGIDMTTGSLGQGFSCAMGIAYASKLAKDNATIYTIIGDGESQEGQIWEAAMFASQKKLNNLIAFIDSNKYQIDGSIEEVNSVEPIDLKFSSFGWNVVVCKDGNNIDQVDAAIQYAKSLNNDKPTMIILNTIKGYGTEFVYSKKAGSHNMNLKPEDVEIIVKQIKEGE